jgi:ATP-dependent DNA ligase
MSIPTFPVLYILNNNQKLYQWSIEIKKTENNTFIIQTSHGEVDGKKVIHEKEIKEGKCKRTILEQATLDSSSKWKNKKEKELYSESKVQDSEKKIVVRPMLANKFSFDTYKKGGRSFKISFPAYVQKKYDGIRCISYMKNGLVVLESRKGIPFQNFDVLKGQLKKMFDASKDKNLYFDGELYSDVVDFETISGLIRLSEKKATESDIIAINKIQYHIYDCIFIDNLEMPYSKRYEFINSSMIPSNSLILGVNSIVVEKLDLVKKYHDDFVKDGYEGIMIREMNGLYEIQKRSKYLQKYKEFMEEEFKIVGFHEGTGSEIGTVIWDCITSDGKTFAVRPKGTFESRKKLFETAGENIGKDLTVIFQEYTAENIPRFPVGKGIRDIY